MKQKIRYRLGTVGMALLMASWGLMGCVTVETTVRPSGRIVRRYEVAVRPTHQTMAWEELRSYLGKGWEKPKVRELSVDKTVITAGRKFRDARELPYVKAQVQVLPDSGWLGLRQNFRYEETMSLSVFLSTEEERRFAEKMAVTYRLNMPGMITQSNLNWHTEEEVQPAPGAESGRPPAPETEGGTVSWTFPLPEGIKELSLEAESQRLNWSRLLLMVVALVVVLIVAGFILQPLWRWIQPKIRARLDIPPEERERRRQEREERKQREAEERQQKQQEAEEKKAREAQEKAAQRAAQDTQKAEADRQKAEAREQQKQRDEAQRAAQEAQKAEARGQQKQQEEAQRAAQEAQKAEADRQKAEAREQQKRQDEEQQAEKQSKKTEAQEQKRRRAEERKRRKGKASEEGEGEAGD